MLIVYDLATGAVLDNTGTSSAMPDGPPDELAYVNTDARGIDRAAVGLLRLHDTDDTDLVAQVLAQRHHVDVTLDPPSVVLDGLYPVETIDTDRTTIPADGATAATVTYRNTHDGAPAEVAYDVNGATGTVALVDGSAELSVTATSPGPVRVTVATLELTLTAEEA